MVPLVCKEKAGVWKQWVAVIAATGLALFLGLAQARAQEGEGEEITFLTVTPATGLEPGHQALLETEGFPPHGPVEVGVGLPYSDYWVIATDTASASGVVSHHLTIPEATQGGVVVVFVIATPDFSTKAVSAPITVGLPAGNPMAQVH